MTELYEVSVEQMLKLYDAPETICEAATLSSHIIMGKYEGQLMCFVGFIPKSMLSNTAYVWLHVFEAANQHKLILGRHAKTVLARALAIYPLIVGHCYNATSKRWLESLGAIFVSEDEFEIRRQNG